MVVYLKHPVHGSKVACSEFEAEEDKKNGWEVYDPESALVNTINRYPDPDKLVPEVPKAPKGRKAKEIEEIPSFLK